MIVFISLLLLLDIPRGWLQIGVLRLEEIDLTMPMPLMTDHAAANVFVCDNVTCRAGYLCRHSGASDPPFPPRVHPGMDVLA